MLLYKVKYSCDLFKSKRYPQALFNLAFIVEKGVEVPHSVWITLGFNASDYTDNMSLLTSLYDK